MTEDITVRFPKQSVVTYLEASLGQLGLVIFMHRL